LHYGQAVFEGLKAFRQRDGRVTVFRVLDHARRFNRSARRLAMPELPESLFVEACRALVSADHDAVPSGDDESLYLRPMMIATEASLGVRPANEYLFLVMASPVGPYFEQGVRPLAVATGHKFVRAASGGTGSAKCPGNYAASLLAKREATLLGCDEVVWLDARERRWVEELSGMNLFLVVRGPDATPTLVTPPLSDTILDGVTRRSLLQLARTAGYVAIERPIPIDEWRDGARTGEVTEAFACGTAAAVAPIGVVRSRSDEVTIGDGSAGPVTMALRELLLGVQSGRREDNFGWRTDTACPSPQW
jgi:branched-chain amino acid aminotransferase